MLTDLLGQHRGLIHGGLRISMQSTMCRGNLLVDTTSTTRLEVIELQLVTVWLTFLIMGHAWGDNESGVCGTGGRDGKGGFGILPIVIGGVMEDLVAYICYVLLINIARRLWMWLIGRRAVWNNCFRWNGCGTLIASKNSIHTLGYSEVVGLDFDVEVWD